MMSNTAGMQKKISHNIYIIFYKPCHKGFRSATIVKGIRRYQRADRNR